MDRDAKLSLLGVVMFLGGLLLAAAPRFLPRAADEPMFVGTWWPVGLPLALAGVALVVWTRLRDRQPRDAEPDERP